jgi:predicted nucleic acid-binding protein
VILIDTSAWIEFFRGRKPFADRVDQALEGDEAAICGPIQTELRRGLRSKAERAQVLLHLGGCRTLSQPVNLWEEAGELGFLLGRRGLTVKTLDLLIASYALAHGVSLLTTDQDFRRIRGAGIPLQLALS